MLVQEPMTLRFTMERKPMPSAGEVRAAMGGAVSSVARRGDVYEVSFDPAGDDEADSIWLMICEIGVHFPGAVLSE